MKEVCCRDAQSNAEGEVEPRSCVVFNTAGEAVRVYDTATRVIHRVKPKENFHLAPIRTPTEPMLRLRCCCTLAWFAHLFQGHGGRSRSICALELVSSSLILSPQPGFQSGRTVTPICGPCIFFSIWTNQYHWWVGTYHCWFVAPPSSVRPCMAAKLSDQPLEIHRIGHWQIALGQHCHGLLPDKKWWW